MTFEEYEQGYYSGDSEDNSGPPEDPETHAMVEHLVEFDTEMYRLDVCSDRAFNIFHFSIKISRNTCTSLVCSVVKELYVNVFNKRSASQSRFTVFGKYLCIQRV